MEDPIQMPVFAHHLLLDLWFSCPQSKMLFLVSYLENIKKILDILQESSKLIHFKAEL